MKRQTGPNANTWVEYVLDTYGTPQQLKNGEGKYCVNLALTLANSPKVLGITLLLQILTARLPAPFPQQDINRSQVMAMMSALLPFLDLPRIRYIPLPR